MVEGKIMSSIRKIWGTRNRLLLTKQAEIDLLYLEKNSACSVHNHKKKINRFVLIKGKVIVKTDLGKKELIINEPFDVEPSLTHQFIALKDSILIELAFVKKGKIDEKDITRILQGGKFVNGEFYTLDELKEKNWKGLPNL